MRNLLAIIIFFSFFHAFSQQGKIFIETNYNSFLHTSLSNFQKEFKADIAPIPIKTVDDFPANIGFTLGYEITDVSTAIFLSYNSTGGKLSYSDYSGIVRIKESLNAITFGGIYYTKLSEKNNFRIGLKAFTMISNLTLDNYTKIDSSIVEDIINLQSFDFGVGVQLNYEYPISIFILKANIGFDLVLGGKLKFKNNNKFHLTNNSNKEVTTGWSGLRTGIGVVIPIN